MKLEFDNQTVEKSEGLQEYVGQLPKDAAGVRLIIDLLSKRLYSDKLAASCREILTNAWDANIEAGNADNPVDIVCPTEEEPYLTIRDYGLGMSPERIVDVYINLGVSTKRENNNEHGGFGIGSISPFTITSQIEVTTYHGGVKYSWVVYKNEDGLLAATLLHKEDSTEPSGTKIKFSIPLDLIKKVSHYIYALTMFADVKPNITRQVEINPFQIETIEEGYFSHIKEITRNKNKYLVLLIGNVPYLISSVDRMVGEIEGELLDKAVFSSSKYSHSIFSNAHKSFEAFISEIINDEFTNYYNPLLLTLKVPIGTLDLTTSREDVVYNDKLTNFLKENLPKTVKNNYDKLLNRLEKIDDPILKLETAFTQFPVLDRVNINNYWFQLQGSTLDSLRIGGFGNSIQYYINSINKNYTVFLVCKKSDKEIDLDSIIKELYFNTSGARYLDVNNFVEISTSRKDLVIYQLPYLFSTKVTTLMKCKLALAKTTTNINNVVKKLNLEEGEFALVFKVSSRLYNDTKSNLSLPVFKNFEEHSKPKVESEKPKKEKVINLSKLTKEDVVYFLKAKDIYRYAEKYSDLIEPDVSIYSLPEEGGIYAVRENLNFSLGNSKILRSAYALNVLEKRAELKLPKVYFVNSRVKWLLKDNPKWKTLDSWLENYIENILPKDKNFRDSILCLVAEYGKSEAFIQLLKTCKEFEYKNFNEEFYSYTQSVEFKSLVDLYKLDLISKERLSGCTFTNFDSTVIASAFEYFFGSHVEFFRLIYEMLYYRSYYTASMTRQVSIIIDYINRYNL